MHLDDDALPHTMNEDRELYSFFVVVVVVVIVVRGFLLIDYDLSMDIFFLLCSVFFFLFFFTANLYLGACVYVWVALKYNPMVSEGKQ